MLKLDIQYCLIIGCLIEFLMSENSCITDSINYNFGKIRINSYNSLSIEKALTFHNVIILIKSVFNKNKITTPIIYL